MRAGRKAFCSLRYSGSTVCEVFYFLRVYVPNWCLSLAIQNTFPTPDAIQSITPHFSQMGKLRHRTGHLTTVMRCAHNPAQFSRLKALCGICLHTASLVAQVSDNYLYMVLIRSVRNTHSWKCSVFEDISGMPSPL